MFSYKKGNEICVVKDKDNKIIKTVYIDEDEDDKKEKEVLDTLKPDEILPKTFYTKLRDITPSNMILLKRAIRRNDISILPENSATKEAFKHANEILQENTQKSIKINTGKIQPIPPNKHWAMSVYGASGCGKSTFVGKFMTEFKRMHKTKPIYVFSSITDDPAFKKAKPTYIKLDDTIMEDPFMVSEFANSLCVFDDLESLPNHLFKALNKFRDQCLEIGRHSKINTISINHVIQGGHLTKRLQNESNITVIYPRTNFSAIEKLAKGQYGFTKNEIQKIKDMSKVSRWVLISRDYPTYIMSENEIMLA